MLNKNNNTASCRQNQKKKLKELKQANRLTFLTFTQIKLRHRYFKEKYTQTARHH